MFPTHLTQKAPRHNRLTHEYFFSHPYLLVIVENNFSGYFSCSLCILSCSGLHHQARPSGVDSDLFSRIRSIIFNTCFAKTRTKQCWGNSKIKQMVSRSKSSELNVYQVNKGHDIKSAKRITKPMIGKKTYFELYTYRMF